MKKDLRIYLYAWLIGLSFLLGLASFGWYLSDTRSHFERVDGVTLYERQQIARYNFESSRDRRYFKWAAFFDLEAAMAHAEVLEETSYQIESDYLTPVSQPDMTELTYAPKAGEVVEVEGLRIPMTGQGNDLQLPATAIGSKNKTDASVAYQFTLPNEKPQAIVFVAQLKQTLYRYDDGQRSFNFQILTEDPSQSYLNLVEVKE